MRRYATGRNHHVPPAASCRSKLLCKNVGQRSTECDGHARPRRSHARAHGVPGRRAHADCPVVLNGDPVAVATGAGPQLVDPLSSRLSSTPGACLLAVRTAGGRYLSRSAEVPFPAEIASKGGRTARFAYRGWAAGAPEPVILAICTIPDAPDARAYFASRFGSKAMKAEELRSFAMSEGVASVEKWGRGTSPSVMQGAEPVYITDGRASESSYTRPATRDRTASTSGLAIAPMAMCDPNAIIPEPGCTPEPETFSTTPPDPSPDPTLIQMETPDPNIPGASRAQFGRITRTAPPLLASLETSTSRPIINAQARDTKRSKPRSSAKAASSGSFVIGRRLPSLFCM